MDTSNSDLEVLSVKVIDLLTSVYAEDKEMAELCKQVVEKTIIRVKPILRYLCGPLQVISHNASQSVRCAALGIIYVRMSGDQYSLFLKDDGEFMGVVKVGNYYYSDNHSGEIWMFVPFSDLIVGMKKLLERAEHKHAEHVEALRKRKNVLEKMLRVLQESSNKD